MAKNAAKHHVLRIELTTVIGFKSEVACFIDRLIIFTSWESSADRQVVIESCQDEEVRELFAELARIANESDDKKHPVTRQTAAYESHQ